MVKIIIERDELERIIKERFGDVKIKWNAQGNALIEVDAKDVLYPYTEVKEE